MTDSTAFWLRTMGAQVVEGFSKAPASRVRVDEGGWLALTGEPSADLNMGGIMAGSAAPALLEDYVAEAGELPAVLTVERPTTDLLERAQRLGAQHVGEIPLMVWQGHALDGRTGELDVHPAATPDELDAAMAVIADAFFLDIALCRNALAPLHSDPNTIVWIGQWGRDFVGAALTFRSGDIAGVYCMATPERHQRQGIGRAVLQGIMGHHLAHGVSRFYLGATEAGYRLYEQLNYQVVATPAALLIGSSTPFD